MHLVGGWCKRITVLGIRIIFTVDAGYKNTGYKNMPVSFVFYPIEFVPDKNMPDIRNIILENGYINSCIFYAGYKNT